MFKAGLRMMTKCALVNFIYHSRSELRARIEKFHIMSHFLRFVTRVRFLYLLNHHFEKFLGHEVGNFNRKCDQ